jgi:S1-C subfamily serine protease
MRARRTMPRLAAAAALLAACGGRPYVVTDYGPQAYYQTAYPQFDTSVQLERIFRAVKRIQVTGIYTTYRFEPSAAVTLADLADEATLSRAVERTSFDHSKAGTAAVIRRLGAQVTLVTNEHVTALPERIVTYFEPPGGSERPPAGRHVETVSILVVRTNIVTGLPGSRPFEVLARDSIRDIALLQVQLTPEESNRPIDVLRVRQGDPARLGWGSFVYVLGYPRGYRMVTTAIVSDPRYGRENEFLLDGLFNRGISGGIILAVRGDTGELEWVGMARAASGDPEITLVPEERNIEEDRVPIPYHGRLYAERIVRIDYGITFAVPMTSIQRFLDAAARSTPET